MKMLKSLIVKNNHHLPECDTKQNARSHSHYTGDSKSKGNIPEGDPPTSKGLFSVKEAGRRRARGRTSFSVVV